ncbi:uncharacterized protein V1518DRAFT_418374 [Limtongia smithiae]|uniref:uncharacterized protein n=1 Tax=Limtongia smithiae TaxID=1125753 RepID=UPI0034CF9152
MTGADAPKQLPESAPSTPPRAAVPPRGVLRNAPSLKTGSSRLFTSTAASRGHNSAAPVASAMKTQPSVTMAAALASAKTRPLPPITTSAATATATTKPKSGTKAVSFAPTPAQSRPAARPAPKTSIATQSTTTISRTSAPPRPRVPSQQPGPAPRAYSLSPARSASVGAHATYQKPVLAKPMLSSVALSDALKAARIAVSEEDLEKATEIVHEHEQDAAVAIATEAADIAVDESLARGFPTQHAKDKEIKKLADEIATLRSKLRTTETQLANAREQEHTAAEVVIVKQVNVELQADLAALRERIDGLTAASATFTAELASANEAAAHATEKYERELAGNTTVIQSLRDELNTKHEEYQKLAAEYEAKLALPPSVDLQSELDSLKSQFQSEKQAHADALIEYGSKLEDASIRLAVVNEQNEKSATHIKALEQLVQALQQDNTSLQRNYAILQADKEAALQANADLHQLIGDVDKSLDKLSTQAAGVSV